MGGYAGRYRVAMTRAGALAMLLVPLLAVSGLTAGVVVSAEVSSRLSEAEDAYTDTYEAAADAHAAALEVRAGLLESESRADDAVAAAEGLRGVPAGIVEADDLEYLETLLREVAAQRIQPGQVPGLPARLSGSDAVGYAGGIAGLAVWQRELASWAGGADPGELDRAVSALRAGTTSAARTASTAASSVLEGNAGASAQTRDALTAAMGELESALEERGDVAAAVGSVAAAAQAVKDSQAAADAAALAAGGSGGGTGSGLGSLAGAPCWFTDPACLLRDQWMIDAAAACLPSFQYSPGLMECWTYLPNGERVLITRPPVMP